jgi:hypothetical protein
MDLAATHPNIFVSLVLPGLVATGFPRQTPFMARRRSVRRAPPGVQSAERWSRQWSSEIIAGPAAEVYTNPQHRRVSHTTALSGRRRVRTRTFEIPPASVIVSRFAPAPPDTCISATSSTRSRLGHHAGQRWQRPAAVCRITIASDAAEFDARILEDILKWLGFEFDAPLVRPVRSRAVYDFRAASTGSDARGPAVYSLCDCSRAKIAALSSLLKETSLRLPGTTVRTKELPDRAPRSRVSGPPRSVGRAVSSISGHGRQEQRRPSICGGSARGAMFLAMGHWTYQFAATVDDLEQEG